jgi:hypothetical protein
MRGLHLIAAVGLATTGSASASAAGYVACAAASPTQSKVFYAAPFPGELQAAPALAARYVTMLREKRYAAPSMYDPPGSPPPPLEAECRWRETEALAKLASEGMVAAGRSRGFAPLGTAFSGE